MGALQAGQQVEVASFSARVERGQDGGDGRFGIEHRVVVAQQAVEIGLPERLAGHGGDAAVMGHDVVAQPVGHGLAIAAGHHAAAVRGHGQRPAGRRQQRGRGITPAAEGIVDIVKPGRFHDGGQWRRDFVRCQDNYKKR